MLRYRCVGDGSMLWKSSVHNIIVGDMSWLLGGVACRFTLNPTLITNKAGKFLKHYVRKKGRVRHTSHTNILGWVMHKSWIFLDSYLLHFYNVTTKWQNEMKTEVRWIIFLVTLACLCSSAQGSRAGTPMELAVNKYKIYHRVHFVT